MSQKNTDGKRSARERLQEQRRQEEARAKRKRTLIAAAVVVAVLGVGAGIAALVAGSTSGKAKKGAGPVAAPQGATGKDEVAIPVGHAAAKATLTVYEDFRCPACAQFELAFRDTVRDLEAKGKLKSEYHLVTLIDKNLRGTGSLNAANAAGCAQDAGKFAAYHDELYRNQPPETDDAFARKARLLELAGKVDGLVTPGFRTCVEDGRHDSWVKKSQDVFTAGHFAGTPTVLLNGKSVFGDPKNPLTPDKLRQMVEAAQKG
ncbi:membrane protein [Streptomyces mashuensis]|uniref:Membrane protein n=1 Tax=Streptomyces mashuensis TaxID=33904 RepID=A0A919EFL6_9ACTN|nr:thioredoxin domain-containing protein [Streptomyces mashuensis]GHF66137.1 membrane protein [Streptomyces mashuensis]